MFGLILLSGISFSVAFLLLYGLRYRWWLTWYGRALVIDSLAHLLLFAGTAVRVETGMASSRLSSAYWMVVFLALVSAEFGKMLLLWRAEAVLAPQDDEEGATPTG